MDDSSRGVGRDDVPESDWSRTAAEPTDASLTPEAKRRTREIREEIAQTREEMSETIEAIQDRLTPGHLVSQAGETVRDAASRKVQQMANTASDTAEQVLDSSFVQTVKSNPIPAAMIGIGAAWLLMRRRTDSDRSRYERWSRNHGTGDWQNPGARTGGPEYGATEYGGTHGAVGTAGLGAGGYETGGYGATGVEAGRPGPESWRGTTDLNRSARSAQVTLERVIRDNPLALGAAAVLVGAAIGMTIPETEKENELMGEARDTVVDRAREMAGEAAEKVSDAAGKVQDLAARAADVTGTSGATSTTGSGRGELGNLGTLGRNETAGTPDLTGGTPDTTGSPLSSGRRSRTTRG